MAALREIRADFDRETIAIYQAYSSAIADAALKARRFVPPFSLTRMTWIKPSFLWLMHRSHWGQTSAQQRILCVRLSRFGWEKALSLACATSFFPGLFASPGDWSRKFATAKVHVQWDPERTLRGASLPYYSIQVGLSRHIIQEFVDEWVTSIEDISSRVRKIYNLLQTGEANRAMHFLPQEKIYPVSADLAKRLQMEPSL